MITELVVYKPPGQFQKGIRYMVGIDHLLSSLAWYETCYQVRDGCFFNITLLYLEPPCTSLYLPLPPTPTHHNLSYLNLSWFLIYISSILSLFFFPVVPSYSVIFMRIQMMHVCSCFFFSNQNLLVNGYNIIQCFTTSTTPLLPLYLSISLYISLSLYHM